MRNFLTTICYIVACYTYAQKGDFLLTNHFPKHSNIDNTNFEITHDSHGRLCIANRSGVLKYDGEVWDFYQTPSAALSLAVDSTDVVYAGCIGSVGIIDFHNRSISYSPLIESDSIDDLFLETHFFESKAYFLGNKNLIIYNPATAELKRFQDDFVNLYQLGSEIFVNTATNQTFRIQDSLIAVDQTNKIAFTSQRKGQPDLAIGFNNKLYSYENNKLKELSQNKHIADKGFEAKEIAWVNDSLFVCSTFESGLILFNTKDSKYNEVTDYHAGLPDNEIYTIHTDNSNGIWAAHQFGITHISPLFPAYSYTHFPGLSGNLTGAFNYNKNLWLTTSLGLFYFDRDTTFENKVYYEIQRKKRKTTKKAPTTKPTPTTSDNKKEKLSLKRLFGKRKRATGTTEQESSNDKPKKKGLFKSIAKLFDDENNVEKIKGKPDKNTRYVRKVRKVPIGIDYNFKKVEGTNGKFTSVLPYKNKLLAVSNSGIYEISKKGAEIIIPEDIRSFMVNSKGQLIITTNDLNLKIFRLSKDLWIELLSEPIGDIIVNMWEDEKGDIWMAGSSAIYRGKSTNSSFSITEKLSLNNKFLDEVSILNRNDSLYFINSEGYFFFDRGSNQVVEDTAMKDQLGIPIHHLYDPIEKAAWIFNGKIWHQLRPDGSTETIEYLGLFPDLRSITTDKQSKHLWLITQSNQLLKYDPSKKGDLENFNFFLKKVANEDGEIDQSKKFVLNYDENFLSIEISKPDFLGLLNPEFQYKLEGLHSEWSDWAHSKSIDFSFLPEGDYKLRVKSKDAFGRIEESEVLNFRVKPPYWQTPWFYAIQIIFFGGLVYLSSRLNQDNSKNRLLSAALTLLTLVLIIEFLQSAIGSLFSFKSTPVVDFLLDAFIAFMIFPLERLLRELMTKGKVNVKIDKEKIQMIKKGVSSK